VRDTLHTEYTLQMGGVDTPPFLWYNNSLRVNQYSSRNTLVSIHALILTEEILISIQEEKL